MPTSFSTDRFVLFLASGLLCVAPGCGDDTGSASSSSTTGGSGGSAQGGSGGSAQGGSGGSGGSAQGGSGGQITQGFRIGGAVLGLEGSLMLELAPGGETIIVDATGTFTFTEELVDGSTYDVTIGSAPNLQTCVVANPSGTIPNSDVQLSVTCENHLLFGAATTSAGLLALFATDGSSAGTRQIADIWPGGNAYPSELTSLGDGRWLLVAEDADHGYELWVTDGTAGGTSMVLDIQPGTASSNPEGLVKHAGKVYFSAAETGNDAMLWQSDGTAAGTFRVSSDAVLGGAPLRPRDLLSLGNRLILKGRYMSSTTQWGLQADNVTFENLGLDSPARGSASAAGLGYVSSIGTDGYELRVTDGTLLGTSTVADLAPGAPSSNPYFVGTLDAALLFVANIPGQSYELRATTGTGTTLLGNLRAGSLGRANDVIVFSVDDGGPDTELWASDGTVSGTQRIADLTPPTSLYSYLTPLGRLGTELLFTDFQDSSATIYKTDGTPAGTTPVVAFGPDVLVGAAPGKICFGVDEPATGMELWCTDGTAAGTERITDLCPGTCDGLETND